ncbi:MAG TPA: BON domain-containing protein [Polyangiaceae bacterium]|jgi:osmotically-inducible protein OsmY
MRTLFIACVTLALTACTHEQDRAPVSTTSATVSAPAAAARADTTVGLDMNPVVIPGADGRITDAVYGGLLTDDKLRGLAQDVDVTTSAGNVILSGHVNTAAERAAIESKVRHTPGVLNVEDRIDVAR